MKIVSGAYCIVFSEDGIALYSGDKLVSHNKVKKSETEEIIGRYPEAHPQASSNACACTGKADGLLVPLG